MFTFAEGTSDSLKFSIKESTLMTRAVLDYEQQDSYVIKVVAKDDGIPSVNETKEFVIKAGNFVKVCFIWGFFKA